MIPDYLPETCVSACSDRVRLGEPAEAKRAVGRTERVLPIESGVSLRKIGAVVRAATLPPVIRGVDDRPRGVDQVTQLPECALGSGIARRRLRRTSLAQLGGDGIDLFPGLSETGRIAHHGDMPTHRALQPRS